MKKSQFNIITKYKEQYLAFNTLTTSMVLLDKETYVEVFLNDNHSLSCVQQLHEMGFLVEDDKNEYLEIQNLRKNLIENSEGLNAVTILLTTACNARCYYCFEKGIKPYSLTYDLCDAIINFIYERSNKQNIRIGWFGGEPLLAFDKLKYINNGLEKKGLEVISHITTNGSLITDEIVEYSKQHNIKYYQITLDDIGEKYNNIKNYVNIDNAFNIVLNNLKKLIEADIGVSIRINYNVSEFDYARKIFETIKSLLEDRKNVYIYLAPLSIHGQKIEVTGGTHPYLKMLKFSSHIDRKLPTWKDNNDLIPGNKLLSTYFLNPIGLACGMEKQDRIVINADGKLYKCHRLAGREGFSCGDVYTGIDVRSVEYQRFSNPIIGDEKCKKCSLLPLCHAGCKANKILYSECDNCSPIKNFVQDLIKVYYCDYISHNK